MKEGDKVRVKDQHSKWWAGKVGIITGPSEASEDFDWWVLFDDPKLNLDFGKHPILFKTSELEVVA